LGLLSPPTAPELELACPPSHSWYVRPKPAGRSACPTVKSSLDIEAPAQSSARCAPCTVMRRLCRQFSVPGQAPSPGGSHRPSLPADTFGTSDAFCSRREWRSEPGGGLWIPMPRARSAERNVPWSIAKRYHHRAADPPGRFGPRSTHRSTGPACRTQPRPASCTGPASQAGAAEPVSQRPCEEQERRDR